jgi:hypothetical protein
MYQAIRDYKEGYKDGFRRGLEAAEKKRHQTATKPTRTSAPSTQTLRQPKDGKDYKPFILERIAQHPSIDTENAIRLLTPGPRLCKRTALRQLVEAGAVIEIEERRGQRVRQRYYSREFFSGRLAQA